MIIGILVGSYSSVFVAGPMLILFNLRPAKEEQDEPADVPPVQPSKA